MQRHDATKDGRALVSTRAVYRHDAWANLHLLPEPQYTREDGPSRDSTREIVHRRAGLVHVKGADDNETRVAAKVAHGDRNASDDILVDRVDVEFQLRRDGDNRRSFCDCPYTQLDET
jgi:hypothetical protein